MEIFQIVGLGIVAAIISIVLKPYRPEMAVVISIVAGIIILGAIAVNISSFFKLIESITDKVNIEFSYISNVLKIIGIAYITQFGSEICKDAGESAIASKIELAGKVLIIMTAAPVIYAILNLLIEILP
jgi:stage III sporulation protein AD